jgi:hypothetical protein
MATAGCKAACLNTAGRGGIMAGHGILSAADVANGIRNTIQHARIRRTKLFFADRAAFMADLVSDIGKAIAKAKRAGYTPAFRLNGTSDIRWESIAVGNGAANVFELFLVCSSTITQRLRTAKISPRIIRSHSPWPMETTRKLTQALNAGMNVAAVFRDKATVARYRPTVLS